MLSKEPAFAPWSSSTVLYPQSGRKYVGGRIGSKRSGSPALCEASGRIVVDRSTPKVVQILDPDW